MRKSALLILLVACVMLAVGISQVMYNSQYDDVVAHEQAISIWRKNIEYMQNITIGGWYDPQEYLRAAHFFIRLTGINPEDDHTFFGNLPSKNLAKHYKEWLAWYEDNEEWLSYDSNRDEVFLKKPKH